MSSFDDIIKQKAGGHEAPVPPDAWEKIMPQKKKRRFAFWFWIIAALIIAGVGTPAYLHWYKNDTTQKVIAINQQKAQTLQGQSEKNNSPVAPEATEQNKTIAAGNREQTIASTVQQKSTLAQSNTAITPVDRSKELLDQNKQSISTGGKTRVTVQPAELADNDISSESNKGNDPIKSFKNKTVTKRSDKKVSVTIIPAETGEKETNTVEEKPVTKKLSNDVTLTKEQAVPKKIIPSLVTKKDSNTSTKINPTATTTAAVTKNQIKNNGLFADISILPFFPIQQSSNPAILTRTTFTNNSQSQFKSTSIKTTLEPSIAFQLALRKNISSRWQLGAGVQYAQLTETVRLTGEETTITSSIVNRLVVETGRSYLVADTIETITKGVRKIEAANSYRFVSIPLFVQYRAGELLGCNLSFTGGLFLNIYNRYNNNINPVIALNANSTGNKLGIDIYGGIRLSKPFGSKTELFAEPTARLNINQPNTKNALLHKQIHQAGIAVGAAFKLK